MEKWMAMLACIKIFDEVKFMYRLCGLAHTELSRGAYLT